MEKNGKSVQEAINLALEELNAVIEEVDIEVLDEGSKGIFGLGGKEARVKVSFKESVVSGGALARDFLEAMFEMMELSLEISVTEDEEAINVQITGEEGGIIIGRRGETLDALQYITSLAVNKRIGHKRIIIDVENYRKRREETLISLAGRVAAKVMDYRKPIALEPMSAYERRIIHASLQENQYVTTYSTGEEPYRKVIIAPK